MEQNFYEKLIESLHDGVLCVDKSRKITFWNKAAERITGYPRHEVIGLIYPGNVVHYIDSQGADFCQECLMEQTLNDGRVRDFEGYLHHKQGYRVSVSIRISSVFDDQRNIIGGVEIFSDNSRRVEILRELENLRKEVLVDSLTDVGNRKFAEMTLQNHLEMLQSSHVHFGVLLIDIDHFAHINESYGNENGDDVLVMVATTLSESLRKMDVVARWSGPKFAVIVANTDRRALQTIAERIREFIEKSRLMYADAKQIMLTVSVGGTMAKPDDTIDSLIERAAKHVQQSKQAGCNCITLDAEQKREIS